MKVMLRVLPVIALLFIGQLIFAKGHAECNASFNECKFDDGTKFMFNMSGQIVYFGTDSDFDAYGSFDYGEANRDTSIIDEWFAARSSTDSYFLGEYGPFHLYVIFINIDGNTYEPELQINHYHEERIDALVWDQSFFYSFTVAEAEAAAAARDSQ